MSQSQEDWQYNKQQNKYKKEYNIQKGITKLEYIRKYVSMQSVPNVHFEFFKLFIDYHVKS